MKRAALAVVALVVVGACSGGTDEAAKPSVRRDPKPPAVDYSATPLGGVPGTTTTTGVPETGTARIVGTVTGPSGVVPGATVRIDHLVRGGVVTRDAVTGADGRYALPGVPGGRYRIRAFQAPALALVDPQVQFLEDGKESTVDLTVEDQRRVVARAAVAPKTPYVGEPVNLSVVVATQSVDADGVVRSAPIAGLRVELDGLGPWSLRRDDSGFRPPTQPRLSTTTSTTVAPSSQDFTDGAGVVRFALQCNRPGPSGLSLLVAVSVTPPAVEGEPPPTPQQRTDRLALGLPECVDVAAPSSTDAPEDPSSPDTTRAPSSTNTTRAPAATTTTTRVPAPTTTRAPSATTADRTSR